MTQVDEGAAIAHMGSADGNQETKNWTLTAIISKLNYDNRQNLPTGQDMLKDNSVGVKVDSHMGWINSVINDDSIKQPPAVSPTPLYKPASTPTPTSGAGGLSILYFSWMASLITSSVILLGNFLC